MLAQKCALPICFVFSAFVSTKEVEEKLGDIKSSNENPKTIESLCNSSRSTHLLPSSIWVRDGLDILTLLAKSSCDKPFDLRCSAMRWPICCCHSFMMLCKRVLQMTVKIKKFHLQTIQCFIIEHRQINALVFLWWVTIFSSEVRCKPFVSWLWKSLVSFNPQVFSLV